jgi:hypothetical protein
MPAGEATDIIVLLQRVDTNGTRVSGIGKQLGCKCRVYMLVVIIVLVLIRSSRMAVLIHYAIRRLYLFQTVMLLRDGGRRFLLRRRRFHTLLLAGGLAELLCSGDCSWYSDLRFAAERVTVGC